MKKLRINLQQMNNVEVLTRSQLRNVLGGSATTTGTLCDNDACPSGAGQGAKCINPYTGEPGTCDYVPCTGQGYSYYQCQ